MEIRGIKNGAVLQRNEDSVCDVTIYSSEPVVSVECSDRWSQLNVEKLAQGKYRLTGLRVGGPHSLLINNEEFSDIYVGDVWILAGQSNMQGIGRMVDIKPNANPAIRALYIPNEWGMANHPLHELGKSHYKVHSVTFHKELTNVNIRGAGPGLAFAEKMYELTHVPQGLIASAHGGRNLYKDWDPDKLKDGEYSLYGATYERYLDSGSNVAGVFWYQGCSDANQEMVSSYTDNMIKLVEAFRRDFQAELPFIQVQIGCCTWSRDRVSSMMECWTSIREQQRMLHEKIKNFDTVHTTALRLSDSIHLSSKSQEILGRDAAEAMFCLKWGKLYGCLPGIKLRDIELVSDELDPNMCTIILSYDNVHGQLDGGPRAWGFDVSRTPKHGEHFGIIDVALDGNRVILTADFAKEKAAERYLWYNYGYSPLANIVDSNGRSLPGFGPLKMGDYIR